jgi:hypothetical protein
MNRLLTGARDSPPREGGRPGRREPEAVVLREASLS